MMHVQSLELEGAFYLEPNIFEDERGYFMEWFNLDRFKSIINKDFNLVQFNYSKSHYGVLRGLHYQLKPNAQAKLVSVTRGVVQDVIVDIRKRSRTYGRYYSVELSAEKRNQLYVPAGFAHGFLVLSEIAEVLYAIDNPYAPDCESGIIYNDEEIGIEWKMESSQIILSEKDQFLTSLSKAKNNFE